MWEGVGEEGWVHSVSLDSHLCGICSRSWVTEVLHRVQDYGILGTGNKSNEREEVTITFSSI